MKIYSKYIEDSYPFTLPVDIKENYYNEKKNDLSKNIESIFINIIIKSMRKTLNQNDLFSNEQSKFYTNIYDENLSSLISKKGFGISEIISKQLYENKKK